MSPTRIDFASDAPSDASGGHSHRSHPATPVPLTSFVGRERELAAVVELLSQPGIRLVTLTGPGGAGKTRLALRVADVVAARFPDGVWFVPFAPIRDGSLVPAVIAQVLGLKVASDRPVVDSLRDYLERRTALLLLDNLEHLLDAVWVIPALLGGCPGLTVLATSRAVLRVSGEHDYPVPALTLPTAVDDVQTEAVRLFVDRARAAKPDFRLDRSNTAAVAEICRRLDGLPLAIELAATRVRALPPTALAARLDRRLPLLRGGARDLPDRQRTMTNAIAWSYDLLTPEQQGLFRRTSVFVGGFGLAAAVAVAGDGRSGEFDVIDGLSVLLDQSLLQEVEPAAPEVDPEPRYRMLETVREYGLEQLSLSGEEVTIRAAHARFFHDWAEAHEPRLHEHDQLSWWRRFEEDHPNFRATLEWFIETESAEPAHRLSWTLMWFWLYRGHLQEGQQWYRRSLELRNEEPVPTRCLALTGLGVVTWFMGDIGAARATLELALESAQRSRNVGHEAITLYTLATTHMMEGDYDRGKELGLRAIALLRTDGAPHWLGAALGDTGTIAFLAGDPALATALWDEGFALLRQLGNRWMTGVGLSDRGVLAQQTGDQLSAARFYAESVRLLWELRDSWYIASPIAGIASIAATRGGFVEAARLLGVAEALRAVSGSAVPATEQARDAETAAACRSALGDERYATEVAHGRAMPLADAVALADDLARAWEPAVRGQAPASGDGLSSREREVLALLVDGATDREIAAALFISPRTASKHVGSILAKLGAGSRAEAAIRAVRDGLVEQD